MRFSDVLRFVLLFGVSGFVLISTQVSAQRPISSTTTVTSSSASGNIRGKVILPDGNPIHQAVRVTRQDLRGVPTTIFTDNEGAFEMRGLNPGEYTLEADGNFAVRVEVNVRGVTFATISLRRKESLSNRPENGSITVVEANLDIPSSALKEFEKASKFSKEGHHDEAIQHLRKATSIYPKYLMAHNDLGAELLAKGALDDAEAELRIAIEIDAKAYNPRLNLGIILYQQHRFVEALGELNKAVATRSDSAPARFHRGLVFLASEERDSAISDLKASHDLGGAAYSLSLFLLGRIYFDRGDRKLAFESFQEYLKEAPAADNAAEARKMLALLR